MNLRISAMSLIATVVLVVMFAVNPAHAQILDPGTPVGGLNPDGPRYTLPFDIQENGSETTDDFFSRPDAAISCAKARCFAKLDELCDLIVFLGGTSLQVEITTQRVLDVSDPMDGAYIDLNGDYRYFIWATYQVKGSISFRDPTGLMWLVLPSRITPPNTPLD